uniref:Eukaryotic translation initiation factor 3 subunit E n=1 Tax=Macrostomum lignano TaxID=282301 RepID=A0A1I8HH12_9PLAT
IYPRDDILQAKLDLLEKTNMVDYIIETYLTLHGLDDDADVPEEYQQKRAAVLEQLEDFREKEEVLVRIFNAENMNKLRSEKDHTKLIETLAAQFGYKPEMLDDMYELSRLKYSIGNYNQAKGFLSVFRMLAPASDPRDALACLDELKEMMKSDRVIPLQLLQQRTWLLHWSLFVFFNYKEGDKDGTELLIDMFLDKDYLNAIQTLAPHLLRYLAVCVIMNRSRKKRNFSDLIRVIQQESYTYRDPITEFLECLYIQFDFDGAQDKLRACTDVIVNDFFLCHRLDQFLESARHLIFETFCRIHQVISIDMLAQKLNMNPEDAEKWLVDLIRNARLDAKIDSKHGLVTMGSQHISPYQQVIEKTRVLYQRTNNLLYCFEKKFGLRGDALDRPIHN